jgi:hypothetical protein
MKLTHTYTHDTYTKSHPHLALLPLDRGSLHDISIVLVLDAFHQLRVGEERVCGKSELHRESGDQKPINKSHKIMQAREKKRKEIVFGVRNLNMLLIFR